jgi:hypothetical protein
MKYLGPTPRRAGVSTRQFQEELHTYWVKRCTQILQERSNLQRDDLEYTVQAAVKLKDQRLSGCIAGLIGWSDDDRAELETFCAIALEVLRTASSSKVREASRLVEIRCLMKELT